MVNNGKVVFLESECPSHVCRQSDLDKVCDIFKFSTHIDTDKVGSVHKQRLGNVLRSVIHVQAQFKVFFGSKTACLP